MKELTPRQTEAINHISNGLYIDQVADQMCISRSTVEKLLLTARRTMRAKSLAHAASIAIRKGLICVLIVFSATGGNDIQRARARTRTARRDSTCFTVVV